MTTKLGSNIDAIVSQFEKEQVKEEDNNNNNTRRVFPELNSDLVAKLNQLDSDLKPTIVDIEWFGYYSTNPELVKEALDFYQQHWNILEPRFTRYTFMGQEEDIDPSLVPQFSLSYIEAIASYTQRWNSMTEEQKNHATEKANWTIEDWKENARRCQREWELANGIRSCE